MSEMQEDLITIVESHDSDALIQAITEFRTAASTWWERKTPTITIPQGYKFWWISTREKWIWHPQQGACGPEGQGNADRHFVYKSGFAGGLTGFQQVHNELRLWCKYEPRFDQSRGGKFAYLNDKSYDFHLRWFCNDHDDEDMYRDNSGLIIHSIAVAPA